MTNSSNSSHPNHSPELKKLNQVSGQIEGVKKMINQGRYCPDIMIQLKAVQFATKAIEASMLRTHLENCIKEAFDSDNGEVLEEKIEELIKLFRQK